jgi:hypothetical protein
VAALRAQQIRLETSAVALRKAVRKLNTFIHHQIMQLNKKDRMLADS